MGRLSGCDFFFTKEYLQQEKDDQAVLRQARKDTIEEDSIGTNPHDFNSASFMQETIVSRIRSQFEG